MPKIYRVWGPPGTGKTSYLLRQIEKACQRYFPCDLGYFSFTVAAVTEGKERIKKKLNVSYKDIPYVRTIHSQCFDLLRVKKEEVMETAKNIREFNENYPAFQISGGRGDEDMKEFEGNDFLFNQMQILRNQLIPTEEWPTECQHFGKAWFEHMGNEGKIDFNGMLEQCLDRKLSPNIKVMFIDESQDLSRLEYAITKQWGEQCDSVLYAGDGNQAIHRWCGADPNCFIDMQTKKTIELKQSYRLSPAILQKSIEILSQAHTKRMVDFKPTDKYGPGQVLSVREPVFSLPGSHMVLFRCKFQVNKYISTLRKANIPFGNQYRAEDKSWNPLLTDGAESIKIYLRLLKGESLDIYEIQQMVKNCIAKTCMVRGAKKKIGGLPLTEKKKYEFFGLLSMGFLGAFLEKQEAINDYFKVKSENAALIFHLANNEPDQLFKTPRITVSTIHGVKGGEADHVWIDPSITTKIKKVIQNDPDSWDDEVRIFYTGATRARKTVGILPTKGYRNPFL